MRKNNIILSIGGCTIRIVLFPSVLNYLRDEINEKISAFLSGFIVKKTSKKPDFTIILKDTKGMHMYEDRNNVFSHFYTIQGNSLISHYYISFTQLLFILTHIIQHLLRMKNDFIFHGSAVVINKKAYLFLGKPGSGKSTIINLLRKHCQVIADDSIILRMSGKGTYIYQTPLIEKVGWIEKSQSHYALGGMFILRKSIAHKMRPLGDIGRIVEVVSRQIWTKNGTVSKGQIEKIFQLANSEGLISTLHFKRGDAGGLYALLNSHTYSLRKNKAPAALQHPW